MTDRLSIVLSIGALLIATGGCAGPRLVAATTGTKEQVKFLYVQGKDQGVIKCKRDANGKLTACREMAVNLTE